MVKRVTTLFNSFCYNVGKQVAQLSRPVYLTCAFVAFRTNLLGGSVLLPCIVHDIVRIT